MTSLSEEEIASRLHKHRDDIIRSLPVSLTDLVYEWIELGLVETEDLDYYQKDGECRKDKIRRFLASLEEKVNGYSKFLQSIQKSKCHMGHAYIASLLEDEHFADDAEIERSAAFRALITEKVSELKMINLNALCPLLFQKRLLTVDEFTSLKHQQTRNRKMFTLVPHP